MFILDFDDTLFDTHSFKKMLPDLPADLYTESEKIKPLLFPDTIPFLEFLQSTGQPVVLLSFGETNWQKMKIDITGIAKFFNSIYLTPDAKEETTDKILAEFENEKTIWFINDKVEETKKIIQHFSQVKPILKVSPRFSEEEYKSSLLPYFSTLTEIQKYVQQQLG